jgi:glycosyltransferase involved in cell wall biosynthesis
MNTKTKVLVLSDHPFAPSGVGTQTKYMIEHMLSTGKFSFVCIAGAVKHQSYEPQKTDKWGDDLIIHPVDGYGSQELVRSMLRIHRPDILWLMTDPRFWGWLWEMEDEIRALCPMVYYHVWDNTPPPKFNAIFYESNDTVVTISKVTDNIVRTVAPDVDVQYLPHTVDPAFKKLDNATVEKFRKENFKDFDNKLLFFWNNRNARRKQSGTLIFWFKEFLDIVGHDKAMLLMHTDPKDSHGQDLHAIINELGLTNGEVLISPEKVPAEALNLIYNTAACTINIADAEGFGLSTLESLFTGTPIIVNMTGGLQQQVTDGEEWFGVGIHPSSKAIIGSQEVPWIFEDRINKEDFLEAILKIYNMPAEEREALGEKGRQYVSKEYSFERYTKGWEEILTKVHETHGSWDTRKNYEGIRQETL